ncbi:aminotransferase class I/II-fold pyridoxal phosphate-dependent enzyme [Saccharopolyspora sp. NPDC000359]|uniref:aminotransferase class I/II-fold pyridoxal phosphate-dependent enzyme n=1 Tax=Saccharopolyspora sp. NPDC000359 TaxID=3154251 RepID=UPI0033192129
MTTARHQLSLNENFSAQLPGVREAIVDGAGRVNLTLDAMSTGLTQAIAGHLGVDAARVFVGPGSGALLQQFLTAFAGGGEVVHAWPSFEMYPLLVRAAGAEAVPVALREHSHDLPAMADAVTERTRVVLLCNPNNPTGTVVSDDELRAFLDRLPDDVLVLIDEAYVDFADPSATANGIRLAGADPRVCVVRTFSKSHGLLGLRVGYLVADEAVVAKLQPGSYFFRVSTVAQDAAIAALRAEEVMREQCAQVAAERDRVHAQLRELGLPVPRSHANFHWLPLGEDNDAFVRFCAAGGVEVRALAGGAGVRVTVGTREANDAVLDLARRFLRGDAPPGDEAQVQHSASGERA